MLSHTSIAVLPFRNVSSDAENEYFTDGMTEEIINALSKIQGLKVTARTSSFAFKDQHEDVRIIGNKLGVATVLEGSIRKAGKRIRIAVQLIRTDNGFHIWSESYDRELSDIFALQDEISLLVADQIRENFGHMDIQEQLVEAKTSNIESYELYLKGRFFFFKWNLPDIEKGISLFKQSIKIDPNYHDPYFSVGLCYSLLGSWGQIDKTEAFQLAEAYFEKGAELGKQSVVSYFSLAAYQFWGHWNYRLAYKNLQSACELNPQDSDSIDFMAEINRSLGDFERAFELNQQALQLNPLSVNAHYTKASLLHLSGNHEEAIDFIEKGLQLDANFELLQHLFCITLICTGKKKELNDYLKQKEIVPILVKLAKYLYGLYHKEASLTIDYNAISSEISQLESPLLYPWDIYLCLYSGRQEEALKLLDKQVTTNMGQVNCFKSDPILKPLASHPIFNKLVNTSFPDNSIYAEQKHPLKVKSEVLTADEIREYTTILKSKMEEEKVYIDGSLNLRALAKEIALQPNKLSWLLNDQVGKNFNEFVNDYRIKTFQEKALNPSNKHLTILGIAYESGFNSKSVFNDFFKKSTGMTPKAWLKQHQ